MSYNASYKRIKTILAISISLLCILLVEVGLLLAAPGRDNDRQLSNFDHFQTGFPLTGNHRGIACDKCHVRGIFKGTPSNCTSCHNQNGYVKASAKPLNHIPTEAPCEQCHSDQNWKSGVNPIRIHNASVYGKCISCHNGTATIGKSTEHINSSGNCDQCHNTNNWLTGKVDHNEVSGTCGSCHDGITAQGKSSDHPFTTSNCENCHTTSAWNSINTVDHLEALGDCSSCHTFLKELLKLPLDAEKVSLKTQFLHTGF